MFALVFTQHKGSTLVEVVEVHSTHKPFSCRDDDFWGFGG